MKTKNKKESPKHTRVLYRAGEEELVAEIEKLCIEGKIVTSVAPLKDFFYPNSGGAYSNWLIVYYEKYNEEDS